MRIGVVHPGSMGAALATCLDDEVVWASEGRSEATAARARDARLSDLGELASLVASAEVVISVCPPAAAVDVATRVSGLGFEGLYVDLNAVSPATARRIGEGFDRFVDGGIIGPPPAHRSGDTRVYLSGREADDVAALFNGAAVETRVVGSEAGRASAVMMAYAAWTKGSSALLLSAAAMASSEGVIEELVEEWDLSIPRLRERLEGTSGRIGRKAWRFVGEMEEIAASYADAGLPDGFHLAAADLYSRLGLKDEREGQDLGAVLDLLLGKPGL